MKSGDALRKLAADLRKMAAAAESKKIQKCAQITLGAAALEMLARKIRSK